MSATAGRWTNATGTVGSSSATPGNVFVIHATLLNTGEVLWFSGHAELVNYPTELWVWDPTQPVSSATNIAFPPGVDIFCCHHAVLEDGRVITAGGAAAHPNHGTGITDICTFDPTTRTLQKIGDMREARWYGTLVTLPDGRLVIFSGRREQRPGAGAGQPNGIAETVELFNPPFTGNPAGGSPYQTQALAASTNKLFPTYPGMHLVKGGKIFYTGTNWRYEQIFSSNASTPINTFSFNVTGAPSTWSWTDTGTHPNVELREEGTSVLLPPAQDGKILLVGGGQANGQSDSFVGLVTGSDARSAEILNTQGAVSWTSVGQMNHPRINVSPVILPDATVLIVGGHDSHKWAPSTAPNASPPHHPGQTTPNFNGRSTFARQAEIFDPATNTFTAVASMVDPRTYHSACLLLPDGRVVCAGGVNPDNIEPLPSPPNPPGTIIVENQKTFEFYEPPYFFKGPRPTIANVWQGRRTTDHVRYGDQFEIESPEFNSIVKVAFTRPGSMTHHTDTEQRYVALEILAKGSGRVRVSVTNDATVAPPGFYMLWIIDDQNRPCERAVFLRLSRRRVRPRVTRCDFPRTEVETLIAAGSPALYENAFDIVLEGYRPDELGITTPTPTPVELGAMAPTVSFRREDDSVVPGIVTTVQSLTVEEDSLPVGEQQNFTFSYNLEFNGLDAFGGVTPNQSQQIILQANRGSIFGEEFINLVEDVPRYTMTLRRTTGDRFVSIKVCEVVDGCEIQAETDTTVFVRGIAQGFLRAEMAEGSDEINVVS